MSIYPYESCGAEVMMLAEVDFSCGRSFLKVGGMILAMEGDKCRDGDMPDEVYEPIPEYEMEYGTIGGESIKGMESKVIRFFRGSTWTPKMLVFAANTINAKATSTTS